MYAELICGPCTTQSNRPAVDNKFYVSKACKNRKKCIKYTTSSEQIFYCRVLILGATLFVAPDHVDLALVR